MLEFDPVRIAITIVNLVFLFLILRWLLWRPVSEFLEKRRQMIGADLDSAREDKEKAAVLLEEHRRLVAENRVEAAKVIEAALRQADLRKEEIIVEAAKETAAQLERAKIEIARERARVIEELRADISNLAVTVAEKMLARKLTDSDREHIFAAAIEELESRAN